MMGEGAMKGCRSYEGSQDRESIDIQEGGQNWAFPCPWQHTRRLLALIYLSDMGHGRGDHCLGEEDAEPMTRTPERERGSVG
jgi:hypothetical protein